MARRKLTDQEMNFEFNKFSTRWVNTTKIIGMVVKFGCIGFCVWSFSNAIQAFGGKETHADVLLDFVVGMKIDKWIGYVFGLGGIIYGFIRHMQLKKTREDLADYSRKLEEKVDPKRGSSHLIRGETHEDDR